jgi:hypothetical protein
MSATYRKRTIHMPEVRSQQIALAAASLGITSEQFVQTAITTLLLTVAEHDSPLAFALARAGGASWDDLKALAEVTAARQAK